MDNWSQRYKQLIGQGEEGADFIAMTLHELKTSLTATIVSAELLADELQPEEQSVQDKLIQSIIWNAQRINEGLSSLSEMHRALVKDSQFKPEPVEIEEAIHNVATRLYPGIQKRKQSLALELPNSLPLVKASRQYLEQILLTLIANASKFTPDAGKIKVSAWQDNDCLIVQVSDTGIGIPAEEQEKIFQSYYQIKRGGRDHTGSGLGLAIVKFLIELQGGKVWLESTVGQGSSFFISLPTVVSVESSSN